MKSTGRLLSIAGAGLLAVALSIGVAVTGAVAAPAQRAAATPVSPTVWNEYEKYFAPGTTMTARKTTLIFQTDGNLVVYDENGAARWASNTDGRGAYARFQSDGNLVVYDSARRAVWAAGVCCYLANYTYLSVQDDGNVVIYRADGVALWATGTDH
jgi:hypothetical protein